jgi:hypothetical protein
MVDICILIVDIWTQAYFFFGYAGRFSGSFYAAFRLNLKKNLGRCPRFPDGRYLKTSEINCSLGVNDLSLL